MTKYEFLGQSPVKLAQKFFLDDFLFFYGLQDEKTSRFGAHFCFKTHPDSCFTAKMSSKFASFFILEARKKKEIVNFFFWTSLTGDCPRIPYWVIKNAKTT